MLIANIEASIAVAAVLIIRAYTFNKLPLKALNILWFIVTTRFLFGPVFSSILSITGLIKYSKISILIMGIVSRIQTHPKIGASISALCFLVSIGLISSFIILHRKSIRKSKRATLFLGEKHVSYFANNNRLSKTRVFTSSDIDIPFSYGIFRPVILIPKMFENTSDETLAFTIGAELEKRNPLFNLFKILLHIVFCLAWYNPFVWLLFITANKDLELVCYTTAAKKLRLSAECVFDNSLTNGFFQANTRDPFKKLYLPSPGTIQDAMKNIQKVPYSKSKIITSILIILSLIVFFCSNPKLLPLKNSQLDRGYSWSSSIDEQGQLRETYIGRSFFNTVYIEEYIDGILVKRKSG